jgi:hypothetical protein
VEVKLVQLLNNGELTSVKLSIINNLEKTLKIVYEHQYRNILSKIVNNKKRFIKKRLPLDASEDIYRYNSLAVGLANYLINLFDVFGESAVLNAKKTFEENGSKWGKKLRKKLLINSDTNNIYYIINALYINVPEIDYTEMADDGLLWHFKKQKFHPAFYNIKSAWLNSFVKSFTPQHICIFEKKSEDDGEIIMNIVLRKNKNGTAAN